MRGQRKPRALRPGDVIGIVAPAGPVQEERLQRGLVEIERLGFRVRVGDGVLARTGFTAGPASARLEQVHRLLADSEVRALVCARGGAGTAHWLPQLDAGLVRADPKPVLGYSDVTAFHLRLGTLGLTSLHGPMVAWELAAGPGGYDEASLWHGLTGEGEPWRSVPGELRALRGGRASGILRGGCLSLLAAAVGSPWQLRPHGSTLLFVEDVDEPLYRLDRMLRQLRLAGALDGLRGLVLGEMKGCQAATEDGRTLDDVVLEALAGMEIPIARGLRSGHTTAANVTLPFGVAAELSCDGASAQLAVLEAAVV